MRVSCETARGRFELCLYATDPSTASSWWIGLFDSSGELQRTWISDGLDVTSRDLHRWLRPIVGYELAGRLTRKALDARSRSRDDNPNVPIVHLSDQGVAKAS